jgi:anti-anti-sigma regulatory factor
MQRHLTLATSSEAARPLPSWPPPHPIHEIGWRHTLILTGCLNDQSAAELEDEIECLCQEGVGHLTLDLRRLDRLDDEGVHSIAFSSSNCVRRGHGFAVIADSSAARRALADAGVPEVDARAVEGRAVLSVGAVATDVTPELATSTVREL